ncbi:sulfotransferase 1B1-like [Mya arenaria]|uniref:sulfotransferase 1B1-like n=1 Tax=Mya arenaria TaxID=6604 RepID=UPI0022E58259|nr:sulfotransferase 1B1-like [Mya arenaria]
MPYEEVQTPGGTKKFAVEEGMRFLLDKETILGSGSLKTQIEWLRSTKVFPDDVIVCAYPKCGTHWVYEIAHMLLNDTTELSRKPKEATMLEFRTREEISVLSRPRILNTHFLPSALPTEIPEKRPRIVLVLRNPKDVAVSAFFHFSKEMGAKGIPCPPMDVFKNSFLTDYAPICNYFKYIKAFLKYLNDHPEVPTLTVFYEHLKKDPMAEVARIATFLGTDGCKVSHEEVMAACGFENMQKAEHVIRESHKDIVMYRKGQVGDWKNYFTVKESEIYDAVIARELENTDIRFLYE